MANVKVTCAAPNVWTSAGKLLKGDKASLPADEVKSLGDAVKADKKPKAKKNDSK